MKGGENKGGWVLGHGAYLLKLDGVVGAGGEPSGIVSGPLALLIL